MAKVIYNPQRLKKKKRSSFLAKTVLLKVISSFLVFFGIVYLLFFSKYFQIKEAKISGVKTISEEILRQKIDAELLKKNYYFLPQNNIFLFPAKRVEATLLKDFPKIKKVIVRRELLDFLEIKIEEREMVAIWCKEEMPAAAEGNSPVFLSNCFFIDDEGVIFESAPSSQGPLILKINDKREIKDIEAGVKIFDKDFLNKLFETKRIFEENIGADFFEFSVLPDNILEAKSSFGWKIIFDSSFDFDSQVKALKKVLDEMKPEDKEKLEYFDLRIKGRIYYK